VTKGDDRRLPRLSEVKYRRLLCSNGHAKAGGGSGSFLERDDAGLGGDPDFWRTPGKKGSWVLLGDYKWNIWCLTSGRRQWATARGVCDIDLSVGRWRCA
jgi:hypothetical protein